MKRPLVWGTFAFVISSLISIRITKNALEIMLFTSLAAVMLFIVLFFIIKKSKLVPKLLFISVFAFLGFFLCATLHIPKAEKAKSFDGTAGEVNAQIIKLDKYEHYTTLLIRTYNIDTEKARVNIITQIPENTENFMEGDGICLSGEIYANFPESLGYSYSDYYASREVFLKMHTDEIRRCDEFSNEFRRLVYTFRQECQEKIDTLDNSGLLRALVLGDKTKLSPEIKSDFQLLGLSHAIAVSGMHLSLIVMSLYIFLKRRGVSKYILSFSCILLTLFYMALTGFSFSIVRASVMMIMYFLSLLVRRTNDTLTTLFASLLFLCANNVYSILDIGFSLSFTSTLGIIVFVPKTLEKLEGLKLFEKDFNKTNKAFFKNAVKRFIFALISLVTNTLAALCASLPLTLLYFNSVTPLAILTNLLVLFFINALLVFSILYIISSFIFLFPIAFILRHLCNFISGAVILETHFLAEALPSPLRFAPEICIALSIVSAILLTIFLFLKPPKSLILLFLCNTILLALILLGGNKVFFKYPTVTLSTTSSCKDIIIEEKGETVLVCSHLDNEAAIQSLIEMLEYRSVAKIDEALFIVKSNIPCDKISVLLENYEVEKLTILPATSKTLKNKREFDTSFSSFNTSYSKDRTKSLTSSTQVFAYRDNFVCTQIKTDNSSISILYNISGELPPSHLNISKSDVAIVYGKNNLPIKIKNPVAYLFEEEGAPLFPKNAEPTDDYLYCLIKFNKTSLSFSAIKK